MRKSHKELQESVTLDAQLSNLRSGFQQLEDHRAANSSYSLSDILMSGLAMFSLKYPSLLQFETQTHIERENLHHLYGISKLCTDSQLRKVLDKVDASRLKAFQVNNFKELDRLGITKAYRSYKNFLVVAIDGVTHFESNQIHCRACIEKQHQEGSISYSHSMLCAMLVKPGEKEVFLMGTEPILCQDGQLKNDCERNASKRLLEWLSEQYQGQPLLLTEDALYANGPTISQITDSGFSYILGIKPQGNKTLFKAFEGNERVKSFSRTEKDIKHKFEYLNNLPLNSSKAEIRVNVLHYEQTDKDGKTTRFSWVTNLELSAKTVEQVMLMGRSRWKIENETFNTLKNQGYHFEHNYGHGKENLSTVLAYLMLLAFHMDQLIQRCNKPFQRLWKAAKTKAKLWQTIRALFLVKTFFKELYLNIALLFQVQLE